MILCAFHGVQNNFAPYLKPIYAESILAFKAYNSDIINGSSKIHIYFG